MAHQMHHARVVGWAIDASIARLARPQHGVVSREQLLRDGRRLSCLGRRASAGLADVDDFALVRLELDQAREAACDRLELG
jgi:hypothetical protein